MGLEVQTRGWIKQLQPVCNFANILSSNSPCHWEYLLYVKALTLLFLYRMLCELLPHLLLHPTSTRSPRGQMALSLVCLHGYSRWVSWLYTIKTGRALKATSTNHMIPNWLRMACMISLWAAAKAFCWWNTCKRCFQVKRSGFDYFKSRSLIVIAIQLSAAWRATSICCVWERQRPYAYLSTGFSARGKQACGSLEPPLPQRLTDNGAVSTNNWTCMS